MKSSTQIIRGIPQLVYELPFDASVSPDIAGLDAAQVIERVIIGPSPYPFVISQAFSEALANVGIPKEKQVIVASGIPLRN